jgi:hypothetical protein
LERVLLYFWLIITILCSSAQYTMLCVIQQLSELDARCLLSTIQTGQSVYEGVLLRIRTLQSILCQLWRLSVATTPPHIQTEALERVCSIGFPPMFYSLGLTGHLSEDRAQKKAMC